MPFAHDWAGAVAHAGLRLMFKAAETGKRLLLGIAVLVVHALPHALTEWGKADVSEPQAQCPWAAEFRLAGNPVLFHLGGLRLKPS